MVAVGKTVLYGKPFSGSLFHVDRVGFLVVVGVQLFAIVHLEDGRFSFRHASELFRRHILGHLLHVVAGMVDSVTPDVVAHLLFRVFPHDVVGSPDAAVVHHGEVLVLGHEVVAPVAQGRGIGMLLVHAVTAGILPGERQYALVVALVLQFVELLRIVVELEIGRRGVEGPLRSGDPVVLPFLPAEALFQLHRYLVYLLGNQRRSPFHVQQRRLDKLRRLLQLVEPSFQVGATVLFDMFGHAVALGYQCAAEFGHQLFTGILRRAESRRLDPVEHALCAGGVRHLVEQRSVKRLSGFELLLFRHDDFVLRDRVVGTVLMLRPDRAYPEVVPDHRIDRRETKMFPVLDFRPCDLLFQLFPQFRPRLPQVGLCHVEHAEHLHPRKDVVLFLSLFG